MRPGQLGLRQRGMRHAPPAGRTVFGSFPMNLSKPTDGTHSDTTDFCYAWGNAGGKWTSFPGSFLGIAMGATTATWAGGGLNANHMTALPHMVGHPMVIDEIAISRIAAASLAVNNIMYLGIYTDSGECYPGEAIWRTSIGLYVQGVGQPSTPVGPAGITRVTCGVILEPNRLYWAVYAMSPSLISSNVWTMYGTSNNMRPILGHRFTSATPVSSMTNAAPWGLYAWRHRFIHPGATMSADLLPSPWPAWNTPIDPLPPAVGYQGGNVIALSKFDHPEMLAIWCAQRPAA